MNFKILFLFMNTVVACCESGKKIDGAIDSLDSTFVNKERNTLIVTNKAMQTRDTILRDTSLSFTICDETDNKEWVLLCTNSAASDEARGVNEEMRLISVKNRKLYPLKDLGYTSPQWTIIGFCLPRNNPCVEIVKDTTHVKVDLSKRK